MKKNKSIFKPEGGLNSDVNDRDLPDGDYIEMRNLQCGFSDIGKNGTAHSFNGNIKATPDDSNPDRQYFTLGTVQDISNNSVIEFITIFDPQELGVIYRIRRVFNDTNTIEIILDSFELRFTTERITHANVVNGLLMWVQPGTFPKKINIEKALKFHQSGGTDPEGYPFIDEQTVKAGAYPPNYMPKFKYTTVPDRFSNFISQSLYQFAYYYVYDDNEISQLSPYSLRAAPTQTWDINGRNRNSDNEFNAIILTLNSGHFKVKKVGVAFRRQDTEPWKVFVEIDKENQNINNLNDFNVTFFGNETTSFLPVSGNGSRNYDYIPMEASTQEFLPTDNITYGNIKIGMDLPKPQVEITPIVTEVQTLEIFAINIQDNTVTHYDEGPEEEEITQIANRCTADLWFDSVPSEGTAINIEINAALYYRYLQEIGSATRENRHQLTGYSKQVDDSWLKDIRYAYPEDVPKLQADYIVTNADVSGGIDVFLTNLKTFLDDLYDTLKTETAAYIASTASFIEDASGFTQINLIPTTDFQSTDILILDYAGASSYYTAPITEAAFTGTALISGSKCLRFSGCQFTYDVYEKYPDIPAPTSPNPDDAGANIFYDRVGGFFVYDLKQAITPFFKGDTIRSLKSGTYHQLGLNYYENLNRDSTVLSNNLIGVPNAFKVYVPFFFETDQLPADNDAWKWALQAQIDHLPPIRATHYKWVWTGSVNIQSFGWFAVHEIIADPAPDSDRIKITILRHPLGPTIGGEIHHSITVGDIIRPVMVNSNAVPKVYFDEPLELSVMYVGPPDNDGNTVIYVEGFDFATYGMVQDSILEIFTEKPIELNDNFSFYEMGQEYPVLFPGTANRSHGGNVQVQTSQNGVSVTPSISVLEFGDVWVRRRRYGNSDIIFVEDFHFSDYFNSDDNDKGRVAVIDPNAAYTHFPNKFLHGGRYFEDNQINNLFSVSASNVKPVDRQFGPINAMAVVGFVLKVMQTRKINSVYIGRTIASNTDGTDNQYQLINDVFGTINPSDESWGCSDPTSVVKTKRWVYFFDMNHGVWCRDAPNGMYPISKYGYTTYWGNKAKEMVAAGRDNFKVISTYDERNDVLYTSIHTSSEDLKHIQDTVLFVEGKNRWGASLDINPQHLEFIGQTIFSFQNGQIWKHNEGEPNLFYGNLLTPKITYVAKQEGFLEKIYNYLGVMSNVVPEVPEIKIPAEYSASKTIMISRIKAGNFQRDESTFHAAIRGDINSPGFDNDVQALNRGQAMRGKACRITLTFLENDGYIEFYASFDEEQISLPTP